MKTRDNLKLFALSSALLTLSGQVYANPEVSFDFSQSTSAVFLDSTTETIISTVSATCPTNPDAGNLAGYLVATANAEFDVGADAGGFLVSYWLSRNSVIKDFSHTYDLQLPVEGLTYLPSAIQRIDSCNEGQTVTYNFMARNYNSGDSVSAWRPRLVVMFIKDRI